MPQKIIAAVQKLFNWCAHSWWGFVEGVLQVVLYSVLWFKWSAKKHCVAKVLLAIWKMFLHQNNRNYNSYRFSYGFAFILLFSLSYKPKTRIRFSATWWSGNKKYFCFFAYSELCFTLKPCRIQYTFVKEFSYMLFLFVLYFHDNILRLFDVLTNPSFTYHARLVLINIVYASCLTNCRTT